MELMRHSDRKLTDKLYTDPDLHSTAQVLCNLHEDENLIKILTNISGKQVTKSVNTAFLKNGQRNRLKQVFLKEKLPKRVFETLVEVAGIEPASRNLSDSASTYLVLFLILG